MIFVKMALGMRVFDDPSLTDCFWVSFFKKRLGKVEPRVYDVVGKKVTRAQNFRFQPFAAD
jgi:hypothetical protein